MGKYHDAYQKRRWKGPAWGVFFILVLLLAVGFAIKGCRGGQPAEEAEETPAAPAVTGDVRQTPEPHDYSILVKKGEFTLRPRREPSRWMKSSMPPAGPMISTTAKG